MAAKKTANRTIAKFTGFHGTRRILTVADQNRLVGVDTGVGESDLVWEPGNSKLDVTDVHEDVLAYLKSDPEFQVKSVEVAAEVTSDDATS